MPPDCLNNRVYTMVFGVIRAPSAWEAIIRMRMGYFTTWVKHLSLMSTLANLWSSLALVLLVQLELWANSWLQLRVFHAFRNYRQSERQKLPLTNLPSWLYILQINYVWKCSHEGSILVYTPSVVLIKYLRAAYGLPLAWNSCKQMRSQGTYTYYSGPASVVSILCHIKKTSTHAILRWFPVVCRVTCWRRDCNRENRLLQLINLNSWSHPDAILW